MEGSKTHCTVNALKSFKVIIFDWDGTAIPDRSSDAWSLIKELENVLRQGVICTVITGTSFKNVNEQAIRYLSPLAKKCLYVCTNRGSEVYGFDDFGKEKTLFFRQATLDENLALDRIAASLKDHLSRTGLTTEIIPNRLNRRKLDLIPIEPWRDPKKSQFSELLTAVGARLKNANIMGGLSTVLEIARTLSKQSQLPFLKMTSDIKHIEIGLTDKADSIRWILEHIVKPSGIPSREVVILGDEFGKVGGLPGSDSRMRLPELSEATYISVGIEPEGVPKGIAHIEGGPKSFVEFLTLQKMAARNFIRNDTLDLLSWGWKEKDSTWLLEQEVFDASRESELEPLFTIGNGYLGVRGSLSIPIPSSRGDLHLAGVYDKKIGILPYSEYDFMTVERKEHPFAERVTFPSVFQFNLRISGQEYCPGRWIGEKYQRDLSLGTGILFEEFTLPMELSEMNRLSIRTSRLASLHEPHMMVQEIELRSNTEKLEVELDTSFEDPERELKHPHLTVLSMEKENLNFTELHEFYTQASQIKAVFVSRIWCDSHETANPSIKILLEPGHPVLIRKLVCVYTSRDHGDPRRIALEKIRSLHIERLSQYLSEHVYEWRMFWQIANIELKENAETTEALRFNNYHMRIASGSDSRISIGARALTGNAYEGHSFWDTEIFIFPFLLHTLPSLAKNCLEYRFNTLSAAKKRAKEMGNQGACFAWESTLDGEDVTPTQITLKGHHRQVPIFTGQQQIHVTADIAFAAWKYWESNRDRHWMWSQGLEVFIETARFWASRLTLEGSSYHILKVIGPDEYHHDVDDNAYTNWMARFNLEKAFQACTECRDSEKNLWNDLRLRLALESSEIDSWLSISQRLYLPKPNKKGVIEQFRGFFDLKEKALNRSEQFKAPLERLLAWDRVNQEQVIKQADVLMIPFLFPEVFSADIVAANYRYYEPRTDHGSSLSPAVHAAIAAQINEWEDCERYWNIAIQLDLNNSMRNTALGIHLGCMGGTWQSLVFHVLGIKPTGRQKTLMTTRVSPIPKFLRSLEMKMIEQGDYYSVTVDKEGAVTLCQSEKEKL